jgi:outer membrane receptor protein involved in Fe transport
MLRIPSHPLLALASALLLQTPAALAENADEMDELALAYGDKATVSIATGSQQTLRRAPAVATVITAEDISAMGATDLDEVLETVPGLHVTRSPNSYVSAYAIRGISTPYGPQTLILQNGIPITTLFVGNKGNIWGGFPVAHIARIEIIRGPGSALYGADAYSGVINIVTKSAADGSGTEFGVRAASFNTNDAWLLHGGKLGSVDVAGYLRFGSSEGFKQTVEVDAQTRFDRLLRTRATLAPGSVSTGYDAIDASIDLGHERWRLRGGYKFRDNVGTGAGIASALDPVGRSQSERITADLSWTDPRVAQDWGLGFTASYLQYTQLIPTDFQLFPAGANLGAGVSSNGFIGGPDTWERQVRLSAFANYTGFSGHSLRVGLGHDDLDLYKTHETRNFTYTPTGALVPVAGGAVLDFSDTNPFLRPQRRTVDYVYVQDEWSLAKDWALTAGLRRDNYSDFGGTTNPRLALVWDASLDITAKLLAGQAFRAPSFSEVYGITNPVALGNANLQPETIRTVEAAFSWQARGDTLVNLSLFRYDMKDIIRTVGGIYYNTGAQNGTGGELEAIWDASRRLRVTTSFAWQRSTDEATQQDAGYAPHHHLYARADWRFAGNWLAGTQVNWVADRKRAAGDLRPAVADYTTVDLTLRTNNGKDRWDFAASVRNLLNADVREPTLAPGLAIPNDLPMAPRSVYLQAIYRL